MRPLVEICPLRYSLTAVAWYRSIQYGTQIAGRAIRSVSAEHLHFDSCLLLVGSVADVLQAARCSSDCRGSTRAAQPSCMEPAGRPNLLSEWIQHAIADGITENLAASLDGKQGSVYRVPPWECELMLGIGQSLLNISLTSNRTQLSGHKKALHLLGCATPSRSAMRNMLAWHTRCV